MGSNRSVISCPEALTSDLAPIPFDGHNETSESILSGLMKSQRKEFYDAISSLQSGYHNQSIINNNNNNDIYSNSNSNNNRNQHYHRRSLPTFPDNPFHPTE